MFFFSTAVLRFFHFYICSILICLFFIKLLRSRFGLHSVPCVSKFLAVCMPLRKGTSFHSCCMFDLVWHICVGFQFGALQHLHGLLMLLFLFWSRCKSSLISFPGLMLVVPVLFDPVCFSFDHFFRVFSFFKTWSQSCLLVIAANKIENSSSAVVISTFHSFSISISLRQASSSVLNWVCFVSKNSPVFGYVFRLGKKSLLSSRIKYLIAFFIWSRFVFCQCRLM